MKLNIQNFMDFLKRSTINHEISCLKISVEKEKIISSMRDSNATVFSIHKKDNNIFSDKSQEFEMHFTEPENSVIPFLSQFDDSEVDVKISNNYMSLADQSMKAKIFFTDESVISKNLIDPNIRNAIKGNPIEIKVDDAFIKGFNKIKKIRQLPSIYITVEEVDGKKYLSIKNADKNNKFENTLSYQIDEWDKAEVFNLSFDSIKFIKLFSMVDPERHKINIFLKQGKTENNEGCIFINSFNDDEQYFLMSKVVE